jgi:hypothetical protein
MEEVIWLSKSATKGQGMEVPAWEVLAHDRAGWRGGLKSLRVNECE